MRLVGGLVGLAVGFYMGNPYAGWVIGSTIGGFAEPAQKYKQEGPRLTDLKVTSSSYGIGIPMVFGTYRVSGNLIFSTSLKETKTVETQEQGKGGGPEIETTTYAYRVTCAYGLAKGVINGVRRIWYEGKLIYDYSQNNNGFIGDIGGSLKVYTGTDSQMPDGSLETELGVGEVPGFRGLAYIVFTDLQLKEFNNRVPTFSFEVVRTPNASSGGGEVLKLDTIDMSGLGIQDHNNDHSNIIFNDINKQLYAFMTPALSKSQMFKVDPMTKTVVAKSSAIVDYGSSMTVMDNGDIVCGGIKSSSVTGNGYYFAGVYDQNTLEIKKTVTYTDFKDWTGETSSNFVMRERLIKVKEAFATNYFNITSRSSYNNGKTQILKFDENMNPVDFYFLTSNEANLGTSYTNFMGGGFADTSTFGIYWPLIYQNYNATDKPVMLLSKYDYSNNTITDDHITLKTGLSAGDGINTFTIKSYYFDKVTRCVFVLYSQRFPLSTEVFTRMLRFNLDTKTIISDIEVNLSHNGNQLIVDAMNYDPNNRRLFMHTSTGGGGTFYTVYYKLDNAQVSYVMTKTVNNTNPWKDAYPGSDIATYVPELGCEVYIGQFNGGTSGTSNSLLLNFGSRLDIGTYPLNLCVQELITEGGLAEANKYDVSELINDTVYGYAIPNSTSPRACIEQLALAYNFEMVESGFKLKFRKNGGSPVRTIKVSELSARNYAKNSRFETDLTTENKQELDLPRVINYTYADIDRDYQNNTAEARMENVEAVDIQNLEMPLVFNQAQATQIAYRLLDTQYANRYTYTFSTNYDHSDLEPCDQVYVVDKNGTKYTMKLIKKEKSGGIIKWTAISEDSATFVQTNVGATADSIQQSIPIISSAKLFWLDIPILQNTDNDPGLYVASTRSNPALAYFGSTLFTSDISNGNYTEQTSFFNEVIGGSTVDVLGDFIYDNITDFSNTVTVKVIKGALYSCSDDDLLNGYNACAIGNEIIQFKNATLIDVNTYKLDTLLRGRFGTEQFIGTHAIGEDFVVLNSSSKTINRILIDQSYLNNQRFIKNVSFKDTLSNTTAIIKTNTGVGLKPYSVNNVVSGRLPNGDINIVFKKRVRGFATLIDYKDVYDMDGDYYEVEIYTDSTYTTVKRTLYINALTFNYTSAEQIADFGSNQANVYIKIFKTNKIIGRGYEKKATV